MDPLGVELQTAINSHVGASNPIPDPLEEQVLQTPEEALQSMIISF